MNDKFKFGDVMERLRIHEKRVALIVMEDEDGKFRLLPISGFAASDLEYLELSGKLWRGYRDNWTKADE